MLNSSIHRDKLGFLVLCDKDDKLTIPVLPRL